jgi:hypothetical protein
MIAYSTSPGRVALDGRPGEGGYYATALAREIERAAGDRLEDVFIAVRNSLYETTKTSPYGVQVPWENGSLVRPVVLGKGAQRGDPEAARKLAEAEQRIAALTKPDPADGPPPPAPKTKPGESFKECDVCPEMVVAPAGSFVMGSPAMEVGHNSTEAQHNVTISRAFAVGRFEVTFAQWDACVAAGGCAPPEEGPYSPPDQGWGRGDRPVINVSWQDAKRYVRWLNGRVGGKAYRLLTEAEWEYAAAPERRRPSPPARPSRRHKRSTRTNTATPALQCSPRIPSKQPRSGRSRRTGFVCTTFTGMFWNGSRIATLKTSPR